MPPAALLPWQQRLIGSAALLSLVIGSFFYWGTSDYPALGAGALKAGLMLAVLWWAAPRLQSAPGWLIGAILLGIVILAARPKFALVLGRAAWIGFPLLVAWWLLSRSRFATRRAGRRTPLQSRAQHDRSDR